MRYWSVESAHASRTVVTKMDADKVKAALDGAFLAFYDRSDDTVAAVFSRDTLLSAVIVAPAGEEIIKLQRDQALLDMVRDLGIGGIQAPFETIQDAIEQMVSYIKELDSHE